MPRCFLGLGGNVGDVERTFAAALRDLTRLSQDLSVIRTSRVYRTSPVGKDAGADYRNAAVEIQTDLSPLELLEAVQSIEAALGRKRDTRWGPRSLDVDLILYDEGIINGSRIQIPHPACWYRRFVLDPLCDIAPDIIHPVKGITIGELRARLLAEPFCVQLAGGDEQTRSRLSAALTDQFPQVGFSDWHTTKLEGAQGATFIAWLGPDDTLADVWDSLPKIPRLKVPFESADPQVFLCEVLTSATDQPEPVGELSGLE